MSSKESSDPGKPSPEEFRRVLKNVNPSDVGDLEDYELFYKMPKDHETEPMQKGEEEKMTQNDVSSRSTEQLENGLPLDNIIREITHNRIIAQNPPECGKESHYGLNTKYDTNDTIQENNAKESNKKELSVDLFRELKMSNQEVPSPKSTTKDQNQN